MRRSLAVSAAAALLTLFSAPAAYAGSQCFKNLDKFPIWITLRYANGDKVVMNLKPAEKRRFDNVKKGDTYCYDSKSIELDECPNENPVHLTSCDNPQLQ